jgi:hypothetical protein
MKQLRNFGIVMVTVLMTVLMSSCNKTEDMATGAGDVLIVAKQSGANTVYGISLYAYTLSSFTSVSAVSSADPDKTYTLKSNQGYKTSFYYETPDSDYTTIQPAAATYTFSATFENGVHQTFQNVLTDKVLPIPNFEICNYDTIQHVLNIEWTWINDASSYAINILDGSKVIFTSLELANTLRTYSVSAIGSGWATGCIPQSGKPYTVRLFAHLYEPGGGVYNMQSISIADRTVTWGK